jgi:hypothetical protein
MTIYFLGPHNKPSGGTKVVNQMVNLCLTHGVKSQLVINEEKAYQAKFLTEPAPVITLDEFSKRCTNKDLVINFWPHKLIQQAVVECPARLKVFWLHGIVIPLYPDFDGRELFWSRKYDQYWDVSHACADYLKQTYNLENVSVLTPFFDDEVMKETIRDHINTKKDGLLLVRRRGQELIPFILKKFSNIKITIMPETFTDKELYLELIKHQWFVSTDNGIGDEKLYPKKYLDDPVRKFTNLLYRRPNLQKKEVVAKYYKNKWLKQSKNLLGFPVTACEAAWLHTNVIAFPMGGGLEWMNKDTAFVARDNDADSLLEQIHKAINTPKEDLILQSEQAYQKVQQFSKENVWNNFCHQLKIH